ncbi:MAG: beta-glucosidase [Clostridiales bacterium]|nr:beta-glucosidase [Clostridiales bacterium]
MNEKIKKIISSLTLEEKASLCSGADFWSTKGIAEKEIKSFRMCDGPSGLRFQSDGDDHIGVHASVPTVSFPTGCAMASSFDRELMFSVGKAIGEESRSLHVGLVLGPAMNIKRTPLCGRNFEYFSEDPYLCGQIASAEVRGIQSCEVGACLKHFACNNQETWRMKINAEIDERAFREIYLLGFETAVKESNPCALMCSYNGINGETASQNRRLLTEILREEWGFDGIVVSDWGAVNDRAAALEAGLDLEMPGCSGITNRQLVNAVKDGKLDEEILNTAVERIIARSLRYAHEKTTEDFDRKGHHELAVKAACEAAVLLKNENGCLPLNENEKVVFIGKFAENPRFQGGGSACVTPFKMTNVLEHVAGMNNIEYFTGFSETEDKENADLAAQALQAAANAEKAVVFVGLPNTFESESYDRTNLKLPDCQVNFILEVCKVNHNVAVVLCSGSPVEMPFVDDVSAVLQMHTGGQGVGTAEYRLLFGLANPCGKLAETYPLRLEDTPAYLSYPGNGKDVSYAEGIFVGYRYYDKRDMPVLFPFGHGLSYTEFEYKNLKIEKTGQFDYRVTLQIKNIGRVRGKEVVQLYVTDIEGAKTNELNVDQSAQVYIREREGRAQLPLKQLKGFEKVELYSGETKTVEFVLDRRSFAYYDVGSVSWEIQNGDYGIAIGSSSRDIRLEESVHISVGKSQRVQRYTMATLMSEISPHPALWSIVTNELERVSEKLYEILHGTDNNSNYLREELKELPLYSIRGIYSIEQEDCERILKKLNEAAGSL